MQAWSNEALKAVHYAAFSLIHYHQTKLDRLHFIRRYDQRPSRLVLAHIITGCFEVYAKEVSIAADTLLDIILGRVMGHGIALDQSVSSGYPVLGNSGNA
ncbi:hypothetical protein CCOS865_04140 [Pseudomonas reidholzensis]|uniref:Uncharacterized protein n=1 Tax=Pseudomonas reidholzensis TaxID=1785162 RepID=A0A383RXP3_9PSED|nr:hypothetical protein CCOS865_04140 [Pseudomonas reidholzensis]